jgi:hypothetical protein
LGGSHAAAVKGTVPKYPDAPAKHHVHFAPPFVIWEEEEIKNAHYSVTCAVECKEIM